MRMSLVRHDHNWKERKSQRIKEWKKGSEGYKWKSSPQDKNRWREQEKERMEDSKGFQKINDQRVFSIHKPIFWAPFSSPPVLTASIRLPVIRSPGKIEPKADDFNEKTSRISSFCSSLSCCIMWYLWRGSWWSWRWWWLSWSSLFCWVRTSHSVRRKLLLFSSCIIMIIPLLLLFSSNYEARVSTARYNHDARDVHQDDCMGCKSVPCVERKRDCDDLCWTETGFLFLIKIHEKRESEKRESEKRLNGMRIWRAWKNMLARNEWMSGEEESSLPPSLSVLFFQILMTNLLFVFFRW